jgi:cardiolipin synthase
MQLLVDSPAFMDQLERDAASATRSLVVQTMSFEGDAAGERLARVLAGRPDLDRTLIIDRYSLYDVNDRFLPWPPNLVKPSLWRELSATLALTRRLSAGGVRVFWTNPVGLLFRRFVGRNHKKLVLVDDRIAYFGGVNVCDHNFGWHDVMLRVDDPDLGAFLRADVLATLRGENMAWRAAFGDLEVVLLDGVANEDLNAPIFDLIRNARRSIDIESAYLSHPFYDRLAEAVQRGVQVTLIAPEFNNKPKMDGYTQWTCANAGIRLRLYQKRMLHTKAMLVDDEALVIGSSNFDFLSHRIQQELMAIVRDRRLIEQFRREVLEPDLAQTVAPTRALVGAWEWWKLQGILGGAWLTVRLSRLGRTPPSRAAAKVRGGRPGDPAGPGAAA